MEEPNDDWKSIAIKLEPECTIDENVEEEEEYSTGSSHEIKYAASSTQNMADCKTTDLSSSATTSSSSNSHDVPDPPIKIKVEAMDEEDIPQTDPYQEIKPEISQDSVPSSISPEIPTDFVKVEMMDDVQEDPFWVSGRQILSEPMPSVSLRVPPSIPLEFVNIKSEDNSPGSSLFYTESTSDYESTVRIESPSHEQLDPHLNALPLITSSCTVSTMRKIVTTANNIYAIDSSDLNSLQALRKSMKVKRFKLSEPPLTSSTQFGITTDSNIIFKRPVASSRTEGHSQSESKEKYEGISCEECSAQFKTLIALRKHMTCHSSEKPFSCEQCSAQFKRRGNLYDHIKRAHTTETSFSCFQCSAQFKLREDLKQHIFRVHCTLKPFCCSHCPLKFKTTREVNLHSLRMHTNERPFPCDKCPSRFKTKYALKSHTQRKHSA